MKTGYFGKLAAGNLKKNARFYIPHILTGAGLEACFYIILTLSMDERLKQTKGGTYLPIVMALGVFVMIILSTILILYTNSFLMKQRLREFGLYNVLGMEKKHIGKIMLVESLISNGISILLGLMGGVIFYKVCALLICRLLGVESVLGFYYISLKTLLPSAGFFLLLYILAFLLNLSRIGRLKPVELLQVSHVGEKEPKVKWLLFVPGTICMAYGYYLALTINSPLAAINRFFTAVILVIIGTYFLFVAGSIAVLRLLKRNKKFYYSPRHMVSVSGLLYRMKQNAVGLASITILATGVLVMISTTVSLYLGAADTLDKYYPNQMYVSASYGTHAEGDEASVNHSVDADTFKELLDLAAKENGIPTPVVSEQHFLEVTYYADGSSLIADREIYDDVSVDDLVEIIFVTLDHYNALTGEKLTLGENEIALGAYQITESFAKDQVTVAGKTFRVAESLTICPIKSRMAGTLDCYMIVLPDQAALDLVNEDQHNYYGDYASELTTQIVVDFEKKIDFERGHAFSESMNDKLKAYFETQPDWDGSFSRSLDSRWEQEEYIYGMYGTLFFLGIILGIVFLFATALIIYYKQISEGYEDRARFQIMQKIGLSEEEVQRTIRSQILMVFFLPLVVAAIHIFGAFHMLELLLHILLLSDTMLFIKCTLIVLAGFAIIYTCIYAVTARVYYRIVH